MDEQLNQFQIRNYKPLGEVVFEYLRNSILNGDLKPGERLMEIALAEQLGVSRTPVREAIRKLEKEKFVEMIPRKGAYVADLTVKDILDVLEIRLVLEGFASSLAAKKMSEENREKLKTLVDEFQGCLENMDRSGMIAKDNEFHDLIYRSSDNSKLIEMVQDLHDQYQRFRLVYYNEFDNFAEIQKNHMEILNAIISNDTDSARRLAEEHIQDIIDGVVRMKESSNE